MERRCAASRCAHPANRSSTDAVPTLMPDFRGTGRRRCGRAGIRRPSRQRCGNDDNRLRCQDLVPRLGARTAPRIDGHRRNWLATTSAGTESGRAALRRRHSAAGVSNSTAMHGMRASFARRLHAAAHVGVESETVDHRRQASLPTCGRRSRRARRMHRPIAQIVLCLTDHRAQCVARHDLVRCEVLSRPR